MLGKVVRVHCNTQLTREPPAPTASAAPSTTPTPTAPSAIAPVRVPPAFATAVAVATTSAKLNDAVIMRHGWKPCNQTPQVEHDRDAAMGGEKGKVLAQNR